MRVFSFALALVVFKIFFPGVASALVGLILTITDIIQNGLDMMSTGDVTWYY